LDKKKNAQLDADLHSPVETYMRTLFTQILMSMARNLRHENLSLPQLAALHFVDMRGQIHIGDICDELVLPQPAASRLISDMVDRGLLERREDDADRRARVISLSPSGRELIEAISRQRVDEANQAMLNIEGVVSERFLGMFTELSRDGLSRAKRAEDDKP
jgi:DNA-binding MarR family transcriptional regulator